MLNGYDKPSKKKYLITEPSFSVDKFGMPYQNKDMNAIATLIMRLFLLEPGTLMHSPECGIGLISKYRYIKSDKLPDFIQDASNKLIDYFNGQLNIFMDATIDPEENIMTIVVTVDREPVIISFNRDKLTLEQIKHS